MNKIDLNKIIDLLRKEYNKEYLCHIQYVVDIGLRLAEEYKVDKNIIEIACLLHDIGRGKELEGETHSQAGKRISEELLKESDFTDCQKQIIFSCILAHNLEELPKSIEEQIVRSADGGSKVEFHEAFMLLCKKISFEERLDWGKKYLQNGYGQISLEPYRTNLQQKYSSVYSIYNKISNLS